MHDLEVAVGQFTLYREMIALKEPGRKLYLAVSDRTYASIFDEPIGQLVLDKLHVALIVFDPTEEVIVTWKD